MRDRVYALYAFRFDGEAPFAQLTAALPAAAQIALVRTLFIDAADRRPDRTAAAYSWLARLQEAAGDQEGALASLAVGAVLSAAGGVGPAGRPGPRRGCGRPPGSVTLSDVLITFISVTPRPA